MLLLSAVLDPIGGNGKAPDAPLGSGGASEAVPAGAPGGYYAADAWLEALLAELERITGRGPQRAGH